MLRVGSVRSRRLLRQTPRAPARGRRRARGEARAPRPAFACTTRESEELVGFDRTAIRLPRQPIVPPFSRQVLDGDRLSLHLAELPEFLFECLEPDIRRGGRGLKESDPWNIGACLSSGGQRYQKGHEKERPDNVRWSHGVSLTSSSRSRLHAGLTAAQRRRSAACREPSFRQHPNKHVPNVARFSP